MNLFGALDATAIPDIPEDGTHALRLINWKTFQSQAGNNFLVFEFKFTEHPMFTGQSVEKWIQYHPDLTQEMLSDTKVSGNVKRMKEFLRSLGVTDEEMDNVDLNDYTGLEGYGYGYGRDKYKAEGREWVLHSFKRS